MNCGNVKMLAMVAITVIFCIGCGDNGTNPSVTTFLDSRDDKVYKKVKIGTQTWMAENLNYNASGSACYSNNDNNCTQYGRLYTWEAAMEACPVGWRLPTDAEWTALANYVGDSSTAGKKLKSTSGWYNNGNGTDDVGFSALPGGSGYIHDDSFMSVGEYGYWWSATETDASHAWGRYMYYNEVVFKDEYYNGNQLSVRCVQD